MDNVAIARRLLEYARSLHDTGVHLYRARAYRRAAHIILGMDMPLTELVAEGGRRALQTLPGVGSHLAYTLEELIRTGEFRTWDERPARVGAA